MVFIREYFLGYDFDSSVLEKCPLDMRHVLITLQVEDVWWTTTFTLMQHGDSKEVFILGGTDDIQVNMKCTFSNKLYKICCEGGQCRGAGLDSSSCLPV